MKLQCRCAAGPHSSGRHEPHCPVLCGDWCEDCGHTKCVCGPPVLRDPITWEVVA